MKLAHAYNEAGEWMPGFDALFPEKGKIPHGFTFAEIPQPCWRPVFMNGKWVETATEEEKNPFIPSPPPSIEEQLAEKDREIRRLQAQNEQINADIAGLMDALIESGVL
ncbi:hypothetical protein [Bacillus sp. B-jedd]|uniref:hypothetical protein n=1 Tax=Bacillus sp. B-jedd TaxID=1476857 RepID=UPI000515605A|nr:hypothetical protein [Bacillus sp. B-jedd]CEG28074.1 hypothetical protein BN1002_02953 [Bacillus sp. B-jedd]